MYYLNTAPTSTSSRTKFWKQAFLPLPPTFFHLAMTSIDITRWSTLSIQKLRGRPWRNVHASLPRQVEAWLMSAQYACQRFTPRKLKSLPLKRGRNPKGKACLPTIIFQELCQISGEPGLHAVIALSEKGRSATQTFIAFDWSNRIKSKRHREPTTMVIIEPSCFWMLLIQIWFLLHNPSRNCTPKSLIMKPN